MNGLLPTESQLPQPPESVGLEEVEGDKGVRGGNPGEGRREDHGDGPQMRATGDGHNEDDDGHDTVDERA